MLIYLARTNEYDVITTTNTAGGIDYIYNYANQDQFEWGYGMEIESYQQIGSDGHYLFKNGAKAVIVGAYDKDGNVQSFNSADLLIQAMSSFGVSNSASSDSLSDPTQNVSEMYNLAASCDLSKRAA